MECVSSYERCKDILFSGYMHSFLKNMSGAFYTFLEARKDTILTTKDVEKNQILPSKNANQSPEGNENFVRTNFGIFHGKIQYTKHVFILIYITTWKKLNSVSAPRSNSVFSKILQVSFLFQTKFRRCCFGLFSSFLLISWPYFFRLVNYYFACMSFAKNIYNFSWYIFFSKICVSWSEKPDTFFP